MTRGQSIPTIIVGLIFLIAGVFGQVNNTKFMKTAVETQAMITDIDVITKYDRFEDEVSEQHNVYVEFEVDGVKYSGELDSYHTGMRVGKTTKIYYQADNPNDFKSAGSSIIWIIFAVIGGVISAVGIKYFIRPQKISGVI